MITSSFRPGRAEAALLALACAPVAQGQTLKPRGVLAGSEFDAQTTAAGNVTAAAELSSRLKLCGGCATGLEESGFAPENAINRNEALPALRTSQRDAVRRYALTGEVNVVAGVFDVRKPYFSLNARGRFDALGGATNHGIETSIAGPITGRPSIVAGAVTAAPKGACGRVCAGRRGAACVRCYHWPDRAQCRLAAAVAGWLSFDISASHCSAKAAAVMNLAMIPARTLVDPGGRCQFIVAGQSATLRLQVENLTDLQRFELQGAGVYDLIVAWRFGGYMTINLKTAGPTDRVQCIRRAGSGRLQHRFGDSGGLRAGVAKHEGGRPGACSHGRGRG